MDTREYFPDFEETLRALGDSIRRSIWTSAPAIVNKDSDGSTVQLQLAMNGHTWDKDGKVSSVKYPLVDSVIPKFIGGGRGDTKAGDTKKDTSLVITHPIKKGDEMHVEFGVHGYDNWFEQGGVQDPIDYKRHELSHGYCSPQIRSKPNAIPNINTDEMHIRSGHGNHTMAIHPANGMIHKSMDPNDQANKDVKDPYNKAVNYYTHTLHPSNGVTSAMSVTGEGTGNKVVHLDNVTHSDGYVRQVSNNKHYTAHHPQKGIKSSVDKDSHVIDVRSQSHPDGPGIFHNTSASHNIVAALAHNITAPQTNVNGNHNVTQNQSVTKNLNVGKVLTSAFADLGPTNFSGGFSTGALEVAADADGGLVQATMGLSVTGGAAVDVLSVAGGASVEGPLVAGGGLIASSGAAIEGGLSATGGAMLDIMNTNGFTVAALNAAYPPASSIGMRAYVTDADSATFFATLAGGGSHIVPAFCTGAAWVIA